MMNKFLWLICLTLIAATIPCAHGGSAVTVPMMAAAESDSQPAEQVVYVTRTGQKYHTSTCRYLSKSKIPMKLKEAKAKYGPCSVCKPPK